jgi:hypothetical protein
MANHQKIFIRSDKILSKSEKRQFKIFASRLEASSNTKFIELFNILDKSEVYDEKVILKVELSKSTIIELKIVFVQTSFSKYSIEYSKSKH